MIATTVTSIIVLSAAMYSFSGFILKKLNIRLLFQQACAKCGSRFLFSLFVVYF
jgi:hypothetical protein